MGDFRVGIIGCGRIAARHMQGYRSDPRVAVVALCDTDVAKAESFAKSHQASARIYADCREMLAKEKLDLVSICLWTPLHLPTIRQCMAAGVRAVHCEKPVASTYGHVKEIAQLAAGAKTRLTFNHQRRFGWTYLRAREILHSGEIGGLQRIEVFNPDNLLDWGTHMIDLVHMYNREVPARWVMAQADARQPRQWFSVPFEFAMQGMIRFGNGVRVTLCSGDDKELPQGLRLTASNGVVELIGEDIVRSMRYGEGKWLEQKSPEANSDDAFRHLVKHLLDTLESGAQPEVSWQRAVRTAEVIYAMYESVRRRGRVELPLAGVEDHPFVAMLEQGQIGQVGAAGLLGADKAGPAPGGK